MKPATLHRIIRGICWAVVALALHQASQPTVAAPGGASFGVALAVALGGILWSTRPKRNTRRNTNRKGRKS